MTYLAEYSHYGRPVWFSVKADDWQGADNAAHAVSSAAVVVGLVRD